MRRLSTVVVTLILATPCLPLAQSPAPSRSTPASQEYVFQSGSGLLFFYVHPDKATDFEGVIARLGQVLEASPDPGRRQQAATWQAFRSLDKVAENAVYVFVFNPAVPGLEYDPVKILAEAAPTEVQALYERLKAAVVRVERMSLTKLR
ncbi:MAG: hypothetical protein ABI051_06260 [Vicinamibacterales bacterium]